MKITDLGRDLYSKAVLLKKFDRQSLIFYSNRKQLYKALEDIGNVICLIGDELCVSNSYSEEYNDLVCIAKGVLSDCREALSGKSKGYRDKVSRFCYGLHNLALPFLPLDDRMRVSPAVAKMSDLLPKLLRLAEIEKSTQRMSVEIEKTRRRVNALEHVLIPRYTETIRFISMKLEESVRSSRTRLMKVKDMMLAEAHDFHY